MIADIFLASAEGALVVADALDIVFIITYAPEIEAKVFASGFTMGYLGVLVSAGQGTEQLIDISDYAIVVPPVFVIPCSVHEYE
jgi:hypothetical protein